jgi:hypothetical protein
MRATEFLIERISSRVFHYTRVTTALKILQSGKFELSHTLGTSWEAQFAPQGYPYFLSTTRTRHGGYHGYLGQDAVLFELDGDFYNQRYPGKAVDYWNNRNPSQDHHKAHEAEDRIFSKEAAIPAAIRVIDLYIAPDADDAARARTRQVIILAKKAGIPVNLFNDQEAWRRRDTRKLADVSQLKGQDPARGYVSRRKGGYLKPWMELMQAKTKAQLSKDADRKRYDLQYTYDRQGLAKSLAVDLSNARKPGPDPDRNNAIRIIKFMQQNQLATVDDFVNYLADKWKNIKEELEEDSRPVYHLPELVLVLDPHFYERIGTRELNRQVVAQLIDRLKNLTQELQQFEPGQKIWVNSPSLRAKLGMRRQMDRNGKMTYLLKTIVKDPKWANPDPTINVENFADGKKPGRKGLAKRVGVNCKHPVSKLRKIAKNSSGERQRMAHWCANMKSGRSK